MSKLNKGLLVGLVIMLIGTFTYTFATNSNDISLIITTNCEGTGVFDYTLSNDKEVITLAQTKTDSNTVSTKYVVPNKTTYTLNVNSSSAYNYKLKEVKIDGKSVDINNITVDLSNSQINAEFIYECVDEDLNLGINKHTIEMTPQNEQ